MTLREELNNRTKMRHTLFDKVNCFAEYEKEDLFMILRKAADNGLTSFTIRDYVLAFPYLVNKRMFEDVLTNENLSFEYVENEESGTIDCLVSW